MKFSFSSAHAGCVCGEKGETSEYGSSGFKFILNSPIRLGWGGKGKMRFNADIAIKPRSQSNSGPQY